MMYRMFNLGVNCNSNILACIYSACIFPSKGNIKCTFD